MKKILLLILASIFTATVCLAQFPGESFKQVTGVVKKIKKGNAPQVVVTDDSGKDMTLAIDPEATYYDAEFYPVTLEKIKVKDRVNIRYDIADDGTNLATWFNLLE